VQTILSVGFLVCCFGVLFGFGITSIAGVLDTLVGVFGLSLSGQESLVAVLVIACFFGAVSASPWSRRYGRRPVMLLAGILAVAGYALILTEPDYWLLIGARIVLGFSVGLSSMVVPMYAAEVTPAERRGAVVALFQLAITAGILLAYTLSLLFVGRLSWAQILGCGLVPAVLALAASLRLPESPRWLAAQGQLKAALAVSRRLELEAEWPDIQAHAARATVARGAAMPWRQRLGQGSTLAVLMFCSLLFVLQNFSGIDAILYYAPHVFQSLGFAPDTAALAATFGLGLINCLATLVALAVVDSAGRRPLLIGGSAVMVIGLGAVVAASLFGWAWIGMIGLGLFIMAFAVSLGPMPYVLMSELFPTAIREQGIATASAVSWLFNAAIAFTFLSVAQWLGLAGTIGIFLLVCLASLVICWFFLPETRRVPLEAIEANVLAGRPLPALGRHEAETAARPPPLPATP